MCTAATYKTKDFYFGRTMDYETSYGLDITITPRNYPFRFCNMGIMNSHYAMIGMACIADDYPLYYDAVNEKGLGMTGLNFVESAQYKTAVRGKDNIAQYEFIPWILSRCTTVSDAKILLQKVNIINRNFNDSLPAAKLHWLIADENETITVESTQSGLHIYDNPTGVLTNEPPFDEQMFNLNNYMYLSAKSPKNNFCSKLPLRAYSRGMGAIGLPGDLSSQSRFVRVTFVKMNSISGDSESESVSQFFHILGSVEQQRGCCNLGEGNYEITLYTSCCNAKKGIYYYTTYNNHQISGINMFNEQLDSKQLIKYAAVDCEQFYMQN